MCQLTGDAFEESDTRVELVKSVVELILAHWRNDDELAAIKIACRWPVLLDSHEAQLLIEHRFAKEDKAFTTNFLSFLHATKS